VCARVRAQVLPILPAISVGADMLELRVDLLQCGSPVAALCRICCAVRLRSLCNNVSSRLARNPA
jgi:hypothetical protein